MPPSIEPPVSSFDIPVRDFGAKLSSSRATSSGGHAHKLCMQHNFVNSRNDRAISNCTVPRAAISSNAGTRALASSA
jgi:hypothetical protein